MEHDTLDAGAGDDDTVFRDLVMLTLLGFVTMVVLMLPHLAPPTTGQDDAKRPGNVVVEARWPDGLDVDVDLWVKAPGDQPVGFSRQNDRTFDLLRDDLGFGLDDTGLNYEFAFSRGAPAGEYIVNVHLYSNRVLAPEVPVRVVVSLAGAANQTPVHIHAGSRMLSHAGHEITVVRFTLDDQGAVVPGSVHDFPVTLRAPDRRESGS